MAFTLEEEEILKLMINEIRTRVKLDFKKTDKSIEYVTTIKPITDQINTSYKTELDSLQTAYNAAESELRKRFE